MKRPALTVVGSCMMDVVVAASRLPAPGETLVGESVSTHVGGKGHNQAVAAARLGAAVRLVGKVGADAFGDQIRAFAEEAGVDCSSVLRDPAAATGVAVPIVLPGGNNSIIAVPQANLALTVPELERQADAIRSSEMLLLQLEVSLDATLAAASLARRADVPVVLNTAPLVPHPPELLRLADVIVANEIEAAGLCPGLEGLEARTVELAGRAARAAVVTLGEQGLLFAERGAEPLHQPAFDVPALDSVGAGDAFCGALAVALAEGRSLPAAARFAQAAAALSVMQRGAAESLPSREEVERLLARQGEDG